MNISGIGSTIKFNVIVMFYKSILSSSVFIGEYKHVNLIALDTTDSQYWITWCSGLVRIRFPVERIIITVEFN